MLERQQRDLMAPKMKFSGATTSENLNAIGRLPDPTKIEDVVDEDNAYSVFVGTGVIGNRFWPMIRSVQLPWQHIYLLVFAGYCEIYNNYVYDLLEEVKESFDCCSY